MRSVLKITFVFLIWPTAVMAQDVVTPNQPVLPVQAPAAQNFVAPSETTTSPSPAPIQIPVLVQTPAFIYLPAPKQTPTLAAGYAPALNVTAGVSVTSFGLPSSGRAVLAGVNTSVATDSGKHFGAKLDLSYERAPNVYHAGHPMDALTYMIGPVFYPSNGNVLSSYFQLLFGGARIAGPPKQVYEEVMKRFGNGTYQKPARSGISYMIAPLMRTYPAPTATEVVTFSGPHYMFYAPNVKDADIGGKPFSPYPFILTQGPGLHDVIILLVGEAEKAKILADSSDLLKELCTYRKYLCLNTGPSEHH